MILTYKIKHNRNFATELKQICLSSSNFVTSVILPLLLPLLQKFTSLVEVDMSHNALVIDDVCQCFASFAAIRSLARVSFVRPIHHLSFYPLCDCASKVTPPCAGPQPLRLMLRRREERCLEPAQLGQAAR